jgi:hypothetical protein
MSSGDRELAAMTAIASAMDGLEEPAVARVLRWAADRFGQPELFAPGGAGGAGAGGGHNADLEPRSYADIYALFDGVSAKSDADRALLAGYWFQVVQNGPSFTGAQVNDALRQMGIGASNITKVFDRLIGRKPALVQQVSKSGRAAQARKQYRMTTAGIAEARKLLSGVTDEDVA